MALNLRKKVNGFVKFQIEGYFTERFINLCLQQKMMVWDVRRLKDGRVIAKIVPEEFKYLRQIAKTTNCRIKILNKHGMLFVAKRYKKRKIFLALIACVIICIGIYNTYIWKIEIVGDFTIPIEELEKQLEEENLKIAVKKKNVDIEQLKINMALKRNDISWLGVSIKGTKAIVEIVEKTVPEKDPLDGIPCNIVAQKDGIITRIYAKNGMTVVEKDDFVQKGDILISGTISSEHAETRYVHADGEAIAKTWYTYKVKVPYKKDVMSKTGKREKNFKIKLLNYEINLLNSGTNFEKYDTIKETNQLKLFDRFMLPLELEEIIREEISVETLTLTKEQAKADAQNEAMNRAMQLIPSGIEPFDNSIIVREYEDGIEVEVIIECLEEIGTKEEIGG